MLAMLKINVKLGNKETLNQNVMAGRGENKAFQMVIKQNPSKKQLKTERWNVLTMLRKEKLAPGEEKQILGLIEIR